MNAAEQSARFGIRISIPDGDPFANLVGDDWTKTHWFSDKIERDRVLRDMAREHEYSRQGDSPTLQFEAISRTADS